MMFYFNLESYIGTNNDTSKFIVNNGHPEGCNCNNCYNLKLAIKVVNTYLYEISDNNTNINIDNDKINTLIKLTRFLNKKPLFTNPPIDTNNPEDVIYEAFYKADLEKLDLFYNASNSASNSKSKSSYVFNVGQSQKRSYSTNSFKFKLGNTVKFDNKKITFGLNNNGTPSSPQSDWLTKTYRVNNYNCDLSFKILIKFFDSLRLDQAWNNFPSDYIKTVAKDNCILLNIYFNNINSANFKNTFNVIINIEPLDLSEYKDVIEFSNKASELINKIAANHKAQSNLKFDVIFRYKYLTFEEYLDLSN